MDTARVLVALRVTMNSAVSPSSASASATTITGGSSSSVMVPVAAPSWMVAPAGLLRSRLKVSFSSSISSSRVGTGIVLAVSPGANVRVPEVAV